MQFRTKRSREGGYAMVAGIMIVMVLVALSAAMTVSATGHHAKAMRSTERARALALAEGAAAIVLTEMGDDATAPVSSTGSFAVKNNTYTRTFTPFNASDGTTDVSVTYLTQSGSKYVPVVFKDRTKPVESYSRVQVRVTGSIGRSERTIEVDLVEQFILFQSAISSDATPTGSSGDGKNLAELGNIVFKDKGRPGQLYVAGDIVSNGGVFGEFSSSPLSTENANGYINFAGTVQKDLSAPGGEDPIPDYTSIGSQDQLFEFDRFIAAARAGAGREFTTIADFKSAMNTANANGEFFEGITVLSFNPNTEGSKPKIYPGDIPGGVNIRGTLLFNFPAGTDPFYKIYMICDVNINPADLSGLNLSDPSTYPSGYGLPWADNSKRPSAVDISGAGFANFGADDDLPALMFNTGIVDQHGYTNISGVVYGPSFIELENKDGKMQYFSGAMIGGGGIFIEGNSSAGNTVIDFDASTINMLSTANGKGKGLKILSWRTIG